MASYKIEVIRRATIFVDDVYSLEDAQAYIEDCCPIDEVKQSDFLETDSGEEVEGQKCFVVVKNVNIIIHIINIVLSWEHDLNLLSVAL